MSTNKMIIDAAHPEEIRVAVLSGNRLQDFDVESVARKQIKGNIYLAKVIRVEPSLQAAFVDYGGNRHGFLSFSEIHPDYYQIPVEDRQALLAEHATEEVSEEVNEEPNEEAITDSEEFDSASDANAEADADSDAPEDQDAGENAGNGDASGEETEQASETDDDEEEEEVVGAPKKSRKGVETLGGDDSEDARPKRRAPSHRRYKIQEVIKRRQILLIQVVKEERGNKGAALTTYISLAGRYCVLMPNTARGGGISRKITHGADRKQLKTILSGLKIPDGMAVIVRTAGIKRTRAEIKRDYEYLMRLWDSIRNLTLESTAPSLVHEEGNLIKRSIRDLYTRDIEETIVAGDHGYRMAKDFIKLLIPSHAKRVQPYSESTKPIFQHYQIEGQLDAIHSPEVQMKSGAYIVINPTEALVSIDVNSGRSTRERNIEETAFKTNLEAADEIARQLRLRDLAGLIVVDFIDMEVSRNNSIVEKRMKDAMRNDRARIQIGRISPFGLLEMSRQRLRMSLIETSSEPCPYCGGTGIRRSTDSAALVALRAIQEEANRQRAERLIVHVPTAVALYVLNQKRPALADIEQSTGISVIITADEALIPPDYRIERVKAGGQIEAVVPTTASNTVSQAEEKPAKHRRRGRRNKPSEFESETRDAPASEEKTDESKVSEAVSADDESGEVKSPKRRRRGKRGGRRRRGRSDEQTANQDVTSEDATQDTQTEEGTAPEAAAEAPQATEGDATDDAKAAAGEEKTAKKPARRRRTRKPKVEADAPETGTDEKPEEGPVEALKDDATTEAPQAEEKPKRKRRTRKKVEKPADGAVVPAQPAIADVAAEKPEKKEETKKDDTPDVDPEVTARAAKTTVINVGDDAEIKEEKPKRGWWRRG